MAAYAEQAGLNFSTFSAWVTKARRRKANPKARIFTPEERRAAVEAFQKSEHTRVDFAKLWGCSPASLDKWRKRCEEEGSMTFGDIFTAQNRPVGFVLVRSRRSAYHGTGEITR